MQWSLQWIRKERIHMHLCFNSVMRKFIQKVTVIVSETIERRFFSKFTLLLTTSPRCLPGNSIRMNMKPPVLIEHQLEGSERKNSWAGRSIAERLSNTLGAGVSRASFRTLQRSKRKLWDDKFIILIMIISWRYTCQNPLNYTLYVGTVYCALNIHQLNCRKMEQKKYLWASIF